MDQQEEGFAGLQVAAFESRRAIEMSRLIERHGGIASVSPSMREVPVDDPRRLVDFANRLMVGEIDVVVLTTGVGVAHLVSQIERHVDRQRFLDALADIRTVCRGPKPVSKLREWGIRPTLVVPEPNTWREILAMLDAHGSVDRCTVAVQEYGLVNPSLTAGLEARGARVLSLKVYDWQLPENVEPLQMNVRAVADGRVDVALFTSAHQVVNLLNVTHTLKRTDALRDAMRRVAVFSIGPTTSQMLREQQLPVDGEPEHPKMGQLVQTAAARCHEVLGVKRRVEARLAAPGSTAPDVAAPWMDSLFMKTCRREPCPMTPVWMMRQAGRFMPEYRKIRAETSFLELCKTPRLASEIMVMAVEQLGVDAAIVFSDLLPILEPMGLDLEFARGEGPVIHNPIRHAEDVDRVAELEDVTALDFVMRAVAQTRADLPDDIPLIGFAGAPFTLASYAIEGGSSRSYLHTKTLMYRDRAAWDALMGRLGRAVTRYLNAQITAGAQAVQLFDSWIGCLAPGDYRTFALPHVRNVLSGIPAGVPTIYFGTGNPALLPDMASAGSSVVGVDWRIGLDDAWRQVGHERALQGNLDPSALLAPVDEIRRQAQRVLAEAGGRPGHIFNLGHGVLPQTPVEHAAALVRAVHELSSRES